MKSISIILICCISLLTNCKCQTKNDVNYYENMINAEFDAEKIYQIPTDARFYAVDEQRRIKDYGTFDYIVIGSGSAGSVVANRLSQIPNITILVIEAGDFGNNFTDIPGMSQHATQSFYNWGFNSTRQSSGCLGKIERRCQIPRGRGYGGTSLINGLVYSRGEKSDFDRWGSENQGWDYNTILRYYKKSENFNINKGDSGYHSTGGEFNVEYSDSVSPHLDAFLKANQELNRNIVDYNGKNILGVSKAQFNIKRGRRWSLGTAFIKPILNRKNLYLTSYSYATKIGIDQNKKATTVYFSKFGSAYKAEAKREIILSAGAILTPHLLMLSGIGPKDHLESHKIKVIENLQVGSNYQDHPTMYGINIITNISIPKQPIRYFINEFLQGKGLYTLAGNNAGVGFFKTDKKSPHDADIEIMAISPNRTLWAYGFSDEAIKALNEDLTDISSTFTLYVVVLHPKSRGTVRLQSNNPYDYPLINPNLYDNENDLETMYSGIKLVTEMLNTAAFKKINARLGKVVLPACKNEKYLSKEHWFCTMRYLSDYLYHPVGTSAMGCDPKKGAVVDNKLRVHGIKNLRVADASVIPFALSGHTNAPSVMVGERLSDFIKETCN